MVTAGLRVTHLCTQGHTRGRDPALITPKTFEKSHFSQKFTLNLHLPGTQTQKQTKSWKQAPGDPLGHMILAIRTHLYLEPDTHTYFVPSPASNRHTLPHRLRASRLSTLQSSTICTSHLGIPKRSPPAAPRPCAPAETSQSLAHRALPASPRTPNFHPQSHRETRPRMGGNTAGAPGVKGLGAERQAAGVAHWVGLGDSERLCLRRAGLRPLCILRPPWRQLETPA